MKKSQNGFVLVSVLLITTISTIYAFTEIKGNQLQERIGGNQQKEMNARLMAEKGVFDAVEYIKLQQAQSVPTATMVSDLPKNVSGAEFTVSVPAWDDTSTPNFVKLKSTGEVMGARAHLIAKIELLTGVSPPLFPKGIVGCDGVIVKATGKTDSYDSRKGAYGGLNVGVNGDVGTIMTGANIVVGGDVKIEGGIEATGGVIVNGNSTVAKGIKANGNVDLFSSNSGLEVGGDINSGGNVFATNNTVGGNVTANGIITDIDNIATGKISTANSGETDIVDISSAGECDNAGYAEAYYKLDGNGNPLKAYDGYASNGDLHVKATGITFTQNEFTDGTVQPGGSITKIGATSQTLRPDKGEVPKTVHVFDKFTLDVDQEINVAGGGDVFIVVKNNFLMKGASKIKVEKGTTLTFLVMGTIKTNDKSEIKEVPDSTTNSTAKSPATRSVVEFFSVHEYSGNDSSTRSTGEEHYLKQDGTVGLKQRDDPEYSAEMLSADLQGKNIQATVHAPRGNVKVHAAGDFYGAVRARTAHSEGVGSMHFDEKLKDGDPTKPPSPPKLNYASIFYFYES